jgi:methyl-accepting chemotaxis protein
MRNNQPITDKEVLMKHGTILVTRTDLKGQIIYANQDFIDISGFRQDELLGASHNIVRHPDMPSAAFADLWLCLKAGRPWTALVKNRTKTGDYYWVEANVTPVFIKGVAQEYLSVRYAPSREQVAVAEALYAQLHANKATLRPKGLAAVVKKVKEISLWQKASLAYIVLLLPALYSGYQAYIQQDYMLLTLLLALSVLGAGLGLGLVKKLIDTLENAIRICYRLSSEHYRNPMDLDRNDQLGDFNRALYGMQVKLNADLAYAKQNAAEMTRIKQALDNVQSCVMVADNNLDIFYMNKTVLTMFQNAQADICKQIPSFDVDKLLGANIDQFHRNPAHQRGLLANLSDTFKSNLIIGDRQMNIVANPVKNADGEHVGTVVEWVDRTQEVKVEQEIEAIVAAVKVGELSTRIALEDKHDFSKKLSEGINQLSDVIESVFSDIGNTMQSMSQGDLTNRIEREYQGVYLSCKNDINTTIDRMSEIFGQVSESAHYINNSSQEIASGNTNLSQRAEQQAASLEETASSMEELTGTVKHNADNAQQANLLADNARQLAESGGDVVQAAVAAMRDINESSNQISEIISVIDEIAFQTNLLALNASVEAARAGEQGRGFSVVATEVRNLAQRSATAAKESKELIQTSVQKVRVGAEYVNQTGKALSEIVAGVKKVGDIVAEIAAASVEQSAGIGQVNQAVAQMDEMTQQNAALAEQASAASVAMSDLSINMVNQLSFFKTNRQHNAASRQRPSVQDIETDSIIRAQSQQKQMVIPPVQTAAYKLSSAESVDSDDEWHDF